MLYFRFLICDNFSQALSCCLWTCLPQTSEQGFRGRTGKCLVGEMPFTVGSISFVSIIVSLQNTWITWCLALPQRAVFQQKLT